MMFDRPRNWKWMVPATMIAPMILWWNAWSLGGEPWRKLALLPMGLAWVCALATVVNLVTYLLSNWADVYAGLRSALNSTPEVRMFEAAKGMHPQAVEALLLHRRTLWRVKYVARKDLADWVLDEAPSVHVGFVEFVLDHSSMGALMPMRLLSEGSRQFDPDGLVDDRKQYVDFLLLLQQKLMCTQALGSQSARFIPPWTPELLRHRFGLVEDAAGGAVEETVEEPPKAVARAAEAAVMRKSADERELTDEEMESIQRELDAYPVELAARARSLRALEKSR